MYYNKETDTLKVGKIVKHTLGLIVIVVVIFGSVGTVKAGQVGVKTRFGAVTGKVLQPGLYVKTPFIEDVKRVDTQTQKEEVAANAASKDLQTVTSNVALNYSVRAESAATLYQTVGSDYKTRLIDPVIQEAVKSVTANFTAEELITKREEVSSEIKSHITYKLTVDGFQIKNFSIINFDFSASFNQAIEAKVTAEQNALAAKNKLSQVEFEAKQAIESAKGRAEALRIESAAISANGQVLELRAIEKWNGVLPTVTSGAIPFINIK